MPEKPSPAADKPVTEFWRPELVRLPELNQKRKSFRVFGHWLAKLISKTILKVSSEGMSNIPAHGPALIVINHLGDADVPAVMSALPYPMDAMAKIELHDHPVLGPLLERYGVIWLHRGRPDKRALRAALDGLAEGRVILIAPEGRYSPTGALEQGSGGAAFLACKSGAPVIPVAVTGTENENVYGHLKKLRRAQVHVKAGEMIPLGALVSGRKEAVAEGTRIIMRALAELLPEQYRGNYS